MPLADVLLNDQCFLRLSLLPQLFDWVEYEGPHGFAFDGRIWLVLSSRNEVDKKPKKWFK